MSREGPATSSNQEPHTAQLRHNVGHKYSVHCTFLHVLKSVSMRYLSLNVLSQVEADLNFPNDCSLSSLFVTSSDENSKNSFKTGNIFVCLEIFQCPPGGYGFAVENKIDMLVKVTF